MPPRRKRHDPRPLRLLQSRPKPSRELEMAEMVGGKLKFMTSAVAGKLGNRHDAGTRDQDMEGQSTLQESVRKSRNRSRIQEVHRNDFGTADSFQGSFSSRDIARRNEDARTSFEKNPNRFAPQSGIAAGNDRDLAPKIDAPDHVGCRRGRSESRADRRLWCRHRCTSLRRLRFRRISPDSSRFQPGEHLSGESLNLAPIGLSFLFDWGDAECRAAHVDKLL